MKRKNLIILALIIVLFSALIVCETVRENKRSTVVFSQNFDYKININTASVNELSHLPGIGIQKAKVIVEYRSGKPFNEISDIMNVKGIGKSIFRKIENLITV